MQTESRGLILQQRSLIRDAPHARVVRQGFWDIGAKPYSKFETGESRPPSGLCPVLLSFLLFCHVFLCSISIVSPTVCLISSQRAHVHAVVH